MKSESRGEKGQSRGPWVVGREETDSEWTVAQLGLFYPVKPELPHPHCTHEGLFL